MNKVQEAVAVLGTALDKIDETMHRISIIATHDCIEVHLASLRDLQQIPGEEKRADFTVDYPVQVYKMLDGVKFFCLLTAEEVAEGFIQDSGCGHRVVHLGTGACQRNTGRIPG